MRRAVQRAARAALALALALGPALAGAAEPLRLEDAVRLALANNERARKVPLRVEAAAGQLERARDAFFPSVAAGGSGAYRGTADRSGNHVSGSGTLTLSQPLVNPSAFPAYAQAQHTLASETFGAAQDRRQLTFDTARAFLQTLASERVLEAAVRRRERARANVQNAQARAAAQLASVNDVTKSTIDLASSEREVVNAESNLARSRLQLGFLIGREVDAPLAPPDRTTEAAERFEGAAALLPGALDRRPDVRSSHERTAALRLSAKEPLYRLIPSLSLQGQMRVIPNPQPTEQAHDETATVNLTWNIFDTGVRYADRRSRLAQAESQSLDEAQLRRSVAVDVQVALVALKAARDQLRIAEEAVEASRRNSEETEILYRQGLARAIEITDANAKRFDAEVSRASARLSLEQAYLDLRLALGLYPIDEEGQVTR